MVGGRLHLGRECLPGYSCEEGYKGAGYEQNTKTLKHIFGMNLYCQCHFFVQQT